MLIILMASITAVSSITSGLNSQYYNQLAREAAESGLARAESCLRLSDFTPTWTSPQTLTPNVDCTGTAIGGTSSWILNTSNLQTTFSVAQPTVGAASSVNIVAVGTVQLLRASNGSVWRTYTVTVGENSRYNDTPQIAGGAGWKTPGIGGYSGHNGYMLAGSGILYGWGDNSSYQLGDASLGITVSTPVKMALPSGVTRAKKVYNSGQGASIVCILATSSSSGDQVFCRGTADSMLNGSSAWQQFALSGGLTAMDAVVNGYGQDSMCVLASNQQAYCAGINDSGGLGTGTTSSAVVPLSAPTQFRLDLASPGPVSGSAASLTVKKVFNQDRTTCVIASDNQAYCAGDNNFGQLGQATTTTNVWIGKSIPGRMLVSGAPIITDIRMTYHGSEEALYALTANGDVFMSGWDTCGTANDGASTTYCATSNVGVSSSYSTPRQLTTGTFGYLISVGEAGGGRNALCTIATQPPGNSGFWCLGSNGFGELGSGACADKTTWGSVISVLDGTSTIQQINWLLNVEAGYQMNSVTVIAMNGDAYSAGDNTYGKLGTGAASGVACNSTFKKVQLPSGVQAVAVANGDEYTTFILGNNGKVYAMGRNNNGQLGNGTTTDSNVPVTVQIPRQETLF